MSSNCPKYKVLIFNKYSSQLTAFATIAFEKSTSDSKGNDVSESAPVLPRAMTGVLCQMPAHPGGKVKYTISDPQRFRVDDNGGVFTRVPGNQIVRPNGAFNFTVRAVDEGMPCGRNQ